jgi:alkanesulfonate monooxygenase SsuD/methylene tetrahydromethanopterin reductase-like flavin-dependent oxidoreductase (luciferase family)
LGAGIGRRAWRGCFDPVWVLRRHPALLAQEAATLAMPSGWRVVLRLGVGARRQNVAPGIWKRVNADYLME